MIRKQLYISEEHERALKARARELGVSEAELARRLFDDLLLGEEDGERGVAGAGAKAGAKAGAADALEGFVEGADRLAEYYRFPEGYRFDRNGLYEDRA